MDSRARDILEDLMLLSDLGGDLVARGRQAYDADPLLRLAAEAILLRVGGLTAQLSADFKASHPHVSWDGMQETREAIRHGYVIDYDLVWIVLDKRRPANARAIRDILDNSGD